MEITEVRVYPVDEDKLKAYVTITLDQCFVVRDLKIIHGTNGLFVAMPSRKCKDGSFKDTAHPLNRETRRMIEDQVLSRYQELMHQRQEPRQTPPPAEGQVLGDGAPPPGFTEPF